MTLPYRQRRFREFSFGLATEEDDPAIRRLLADNPVPGNVAITYEREPNYFLGCGTMGRFWQVAVARHTPTGKIVGLACRATRPVFINGSVEEVGYLGQLRVDSRFRGRWLLAFAMQFGRELHGDGRVRGYITTIIEDNRTAIGVLVRHPRPHHPIYREAGRIKTLAIILQKPRSPGPSACQIGRGSDFSLAETVSFLRKHGNQKQFFPAYDMDDFQDGTTTLGFNLDDFFIAHRNGSITGVMGLWDQSAFKQTVVHSYSGRLRFARPIYNAVSRVTGRKPLPAEGQAIHNIYGSFICVENNRPDIFRDLLGHAYNEATKREYTSLSIGLDSRDPLLKVVEEFPHVAYPSRLYTVSWDGEGDFHAKLDVASRIPYVEIASL